MEIIDTVAAYALEIGDLVSIDDDLVAITDIDDEDHTIMVKGASHSTGDMVEYPLEPDERFNLFGA